MVDDQDMCEWVKVETNVSSGTGSPRYSTTKGRKTIAAVVDAVGRVAGRASSL